MYPFNLESVNWAKVFNNLLEGNSWPQSASQFPSVFEFTMALLAKFDAANSSSEFGLCKPPTLLFIDIICENPFCILSFSGNVLHAESMASSRSVAYGSSTQRMIQGAGSGPLHVFCCFKNSRIKVAIW